MNDFEQKLAAFKPRVQKKMTLQTPRRCVEPEYQPHFWLRYVAVGMACFVLGAAAMYGLQNFPSKKKPPPSSPPPGYAVIDFSEAEMAKLRRPIDVLRIAKVKAPVPARVKEPEEPSLFRLAQEYQTR